MAENDKLDEQFCDFSLGTPAIVCRWRLQECKLPLENRHLRALSNRKVAGKNVSPQLIAWAKQHVEWTLTSGAADNPDGVLMLVIDTEGHAAMTVGPYEPLAATSAADLAARAATAASERATLGIAPETLWAVDGNTLTCGAFEGEKPSGIVSLLVDLARAKGLKVVFDPDLAPAGHAEVFLASDEHGVVSATDAAGPVSQELQADYMKLLSSMRSHR